MFWRGNTLCSIWRTDHSTRSEKNIMTRVGLQIATEEQAPAIWDLRMAVGAKLTERFGHGPWSSRGTVKSVLYDLRNSVVYAATRRSKVIATLVLCTRKPWAIDRKYFSACKKPLYLLSMAVAPDLQGQGIGRLCMTEVERITKAWPADAIFLDAYDAKAGAGEFYRKCGFREVGRASYRNVPLVYFELLV
jgi:ribosomal protein S18 acetylase RimI-like enzyme